MVQRTLVCAGLPPVQLEMNPEVLAELARE